MSKSHFRVNQGITFNVKDGPPLDPEEGDIYFDKTKNDLLKFKGTKWRPIGSGGAASVEVSLTSHGFDTLDCVYFDGTDWKLAASDDSETLATYVVFKEDNDSFTAVMYGMLEVPGHGLTEGEFYFCSETVPGDLDVNEGSLFSNPVLQVVDEDRVMICVYRPNVATSGLLVENNRIGEVIYSPNSNTPDHFISASNKSIGATLSAANFKGTEYKKLYELLWGLSTTTPTDTFVISSAKGVNWEADWDANKIITIDYKDYFLRAGTTGIGVYQADEFKSHTHIQNAHSHAYSIPNTAHSNSGIGADPVKTQFGSVSTGATTATNQNTGGAETRPKNTSHYIYIRYKETTYIANVEIESAKISYDESQSLLDVDTVQAAIDILIPPGTINAFGGIAAPKGYLICDGSAISRAVYTRLFATIGTNFGAGDGSTTFNLPDLRGQFLRGSDNGAGRDPDRLGAGVGSTQGDAMRRLYGRSQFRSLVTPDNNLFTTQDMTGTLKVYPGAGLNYSVGAATASAGSYRAGYLDFDNLGYTNVGSDNRPTNVSVNFIIKA